MLSKNLKNNRWSSAGQSAGPLFFSIYVNDLPRNLKHCSYHLYADNFIAISKMNENLSNIAQWVPRNDLIINPRKTQTLWIGSRGFMRQLDESNLLSILLDGTPIVPGNSLKILDVTIDSTLSRQITATTWLRSATFTSATQEVSRISNTSNQAALSQVTCIPAPGVRRLRLHGHLR